jgi:hypothetical protein
MRLRLEGEECGLSFWVVKLQRRMKPSLDLSTGVSKELDDTPEKFVWFISSSILV